MRERDRERESARVLDLLRASSTGPTGAGRDETVDRKWWPLFALVDGRASARSSFGRPTSASSLPLGVVFFPFLSVFRRFLSLSVGLSSFSFLFLRSKGFSFPFVGWRATRTRSYSLGHSPSGRFTTFSLAQRPETTPRLAWTRPPPVHTQRVVALWSQNGETNGRDGWRLTTTTYDCYRPGSTRHGPWLDLQDRCKCRCC